MNKKFFWILCLTLLTLGSGLVNLYSVIGPGLPERIAVLRGIFPLEFLHLSRFLTILLGFALIIASLNIYNRKKRAFQSVLLLGILSVIFHLTKSLDYEEAIFSLVLIILLLYTRNYFTVKSSIPDLRLELIRLGLSIIITLAYGIAGFWLLDRREFGIDFAIGDSILKTIHFLTFRGDPEIIPHTHYARWYLDSLYLITITAMGYSIFSLFRPVIYKYRTHPRELSIAAEIVKNHGRSALDFFKYWSDKSLFFSSTMASFIAYRVGVNYALTLGDPVGPEEEMSDIIRNFKLFCEDNGWGIGFHQTSTDYLPIYQNLGFKKLKIGDDAIVELNKFALEGGKKKDLRHKINQFEKSGISVIEYCPPITDEILFQIKEVSDEWLKIPGRRERSFTLGKFDTEYLRSTTLFVVLNNDKKILAFLNIIQSFKKGESTIDLMRHRIEIPNGIMDYLFTKLILYLKEKNFDRFNMGMVPMSGFQDREDAAIEERAIHYFAQRLNFLFSFTGLKKFKAKFATLWEPRYPVYCNTFDLPRLGIALSKISEVN